MPITSKWYDFTKENVDRSPAQHGVYVLYSGSELIYIGRAAGTGVTIRSRLQDHQSGREGLGTAIATMYRREETENAAARERQLLQEFAAETGRLPRCNSVMP